MAELYNKVVFGERALLDLTSDTVAPENLMQGETAHDRTGAQIVGTATSGSDTEDATATAGDLLEGATAYAKGEKIEGTIPMVDAAKPTVEVDENGNITATNAQARGYIAESSTKQTTIPQDKVEVSTPVVTVDGNQVTATNTQVKGFTNGGTTSASATIPTTQQATPAITIDGNKVTAQATQSAGYVAAGTKSSSATIPSVTQATPTIAVEGNQITATVNQNAGYTAGGVKSSTATIPSVSVATPSIAFSGATVIATNNQASGYTAGGTKSASVTMPAVQGRTIAPTSQQQTAIESGAFALGSVIVDAIPSTYIQPSGTSEITANGVYDVRSFESASVNVDGYTLYEAINRTRYSNKMSNSELSRIGTYAFYECRQLTDVNFPAVSIVENHAFYLCNGLSTVALNNAEVVQSYAFYTCNSLKQIVLPKIRIINEYAFNVCTNLSQIVLGKSLNIIYSGAFQRCERLLSLNLTSCISLPTLINSNAFVSTPIAGYSYYTSQYGSIYVPASLYDAFISANNWSYFSSRMVSV